MQRRAATALAAQALREFRNRAALAQAPATFRASYGQGVTAAGRALHADVPRNAGEAAPQAPPETDAAPSEQEERLGLIFTCNKCDNRAMRSFSRQAYNDGVVIVQCPQCQSRHLIADNLGWFGEKSSIESIMAEKGHDVRWHEAGGTLELTAGDVAAWAEAASESKQAAEGKQ